jgi:hypothetical protein
MNMKFCVSYTHIVFTAITFNHISTFLKLRMHMLKKETFFKLCWGKNLIYPQIPINLPLFESHRNSKKVQNWSILDSCSLSRIKYSIYPCHWMTRGCSIQAMLSSVATPTILSPLSSSLSSWQQVWHPDKRIANRIASWQQLFRHRPQSLLPQIVTRMTAIDLNEAHRTSALVCRYTSLNVSRGGSAKR